MVSSKMNIIFWFLYGMCIERIHSLVIERKYSFCSITCHNKFRGCVDGDVGSSQVQPMLFCQQKVAMCERDCSIPPKEVPCEHRCKNSFGTCMNGKGKDYPVQNGLVCMQKYSICKFLCDAKQFNTRKKKKKRVMIER